MALTGGHVAGVTMGHTADHNLIDGILGGLGSTYAPPSLNGVERIRALVRAGSITAARPLVPIGDSHTDNTTGAHFAWDLLKAARNQPGEGMEGVPAAGIVPMGRNGSTLAAYTADPAGVGGFNAAMALAPSVTLSCWLTNDVRLGGLGTTVAAIRVAGAALLNAHVAAIKAHANRPDVIALRVPVPITTVNTGADNYVSDGTTINAAGIAQIYTDGMRAAHYDVLKTHRDVVIYDPQVRCYGIVSPTANTGYYSNQIHQSQSGYEAEADDFAAWIDAAQPYSVARSLAARTAQPVTPWVGYHRDVEDTTRYALLGEFILWTATPTTFVDLGPVVGPPIPGNLVAYDLIEIVAAGVTVQIADGTVPTVSGTNVRVTGLTIPANTAPVGTKVRVYRRTLGTDTVVNTALYDTSWRFKRTGRWQTSGVTTYGDIEVLSMTAARAMQPASEWAALMQAGDKVYVEGVGLAFTIGTDATANASATSLRLNPIASVDHTSWVGKQVVIVGAHA